MTDRHEAECDRVEAEFNGVEVPPEEQAIRLECIKLAVHHETAQAFVDFVTRGRDADLRMECLRLSVDPYRRPAMPRDQEPVLTRAAEHYEFVTGRKPT